MSQALPRTIGPFDVPQDRTSAASWEWAAATLPDYLLHHSVRAYAWGAAIARGEGWDFDTRVLWNAALFHDVGLTRVGRNSRCFEYEGAERARRFVQRHGMPAAAAERVATAIILHMAPGVTLADGVESVLLDRSTGLDVRGVDYGLVDGVRDDGHGGGTARSVRPPFRRRDRTGSRPAHGLPEPAPAPRLRSRRLDGAFAMGGDLTVTSGRGRASSRHSHRGPIAPNEDVRCQPEGRSSPPRWW